MSIPKITGREAREFLDAAETPPPWRVDRQETPQGHVSQVVGPVEKTQMTFDFLPVVATNLTETDADLAAAAPALAETVEWLYGQPAHRTWDHILYWWEAGDEVSVAASAGVVSCFAATGEDATTLTPDEAVEFARALLAAAEEARP